MWGKFFASAFTGSMTGAGLNVFAVWGYVIANAVNSQVELNPKMLAPILGTTEGEVVTAIKYLCEPDPHSRSPAANGRRIIQEGAFAYHVVNHQAYRAIRDEQDRREYNREKKAEGRAKGVNVTPSRRVNTSVKRSIARSTRSAQAEAETDTEAETTTTARVRANWVRRLGTIWRNRYHGTPPWGQIGKHLLPLRDEPELDYRFTAYLAVTEPQFVNLPKFVAAFGSWGNGKKRPQTYTYEPGHSGPEL